jgi:hypothetical protein
MSPDVTERRSCWASVQLAPRHMVYWGYLIATLIMVSSMLSCGSLHPRQVCNLSIRYKNGMSVPDRDVKLIYPGGEKRVGPLAPGQSATWKLRVETGSKVSIVSEVPAEEQQLHSIEIPTFQVGSADYDVTKLDKRLLMSVYYSID